MAEGSLEPVSSSGRIKGRNRKTPEVNRLIFPRVAGAVPRPETLQLFGCYLVDRRNKLGLSQTDFADRTSRRLDWVANVERGACCPTPRGFIALRKGFREPGQPPPELDPGADFQHLDAEPLGAMAKSLREDYGIPGPSLPVHAAADPDGLIPLLKGIRHQDRLLTLAPLILLVVLSFMFIVGQPWHGNGFDFMKPDFQFWPLLGLGVVSYSSLVLPPMGRRLQAWSLLTRAGSVPDWYNQARVTREDEQAINPTGGWFHAEEAIYIIPEHRDEVRTTCLETDLLERLILTFGAAVGFGVLAIATALHADTDLNSWSPWAVLLVLLVGLLAMTWRRRATVASNVPRALMWGYGLPSRSLRSGSTAP